MGKYSFSGIRKTGVAGLRLVLATTTFGKWMIASPFRKVFELFEGWAIEWLINRGLVIINIGAIYVNGEFDQDKFDKAMESGLEKAKVPGLTDAQKKVIDDEVLKAARAFARVAKPK